MECGLKTIEEEAIKLIDFWGGRGEVVGYKRERERERERVSVCVCV